MPAVAVFLVLGAAVAEAMSPITRRELGGALASAGFGSALPSAAAAAASTGDRNAVLNNGLVFPRASFGLQIYDDQKAYELTLVALEAGFRNFFASVLAGNQRGFARAVKDSSIPRDQLFICGSVVSNNAFGFDKAFSATRRGCKQNMGAFSAGNIDYLDMIMLDYPGPDAESIRGQWAAVEEMRQQKLTKSLAVSNFSPAQLDCLLSDAELAKPTVNQLRYSVAVHPPGMVEANNNRGVLVQSWSPLSSLSRPTKALCADIGKGYGKSGAQVALRWIVQNKASFRTQSKNPAHFKEDLEVFDFELTDAEMAQLSRAS